MLSNVILSTGISVVASKKFLHFSKHHFPKDSESGLKSRKISSLSFLTDLKHPNRHTHNVNRTLKLEINNKNSISFLYFENSLL